MIVVEVPGESAEKRSLLEEQRQLTQELITLVSTDIKRLYMILDNFSEMHSMAFPAFKTEIEAYVSETKEMLAHTLYSLRTGDLDSTAHVRLVERLANIYQIDNKIR